MEIVAQQATADLWSAARADVPVQAFSNFRQYLQSMYDWQKKRHATYSYLQYSADLGLSKSNVMRLVIIGKRPFTFKSAARVAASIGLEGTELRYFETMVQLATTTDPAARAAAQAQLAALQAQMGQAEPSEQPYNLFSQWYYPVIAEMMTSVYFRSDPYWIAEHLIPRIQPEQAQKALVVLEKLGLATFDQERGRHFPTGKPIAPSDTVKTSDLMRYYEKMSDLGREAIARLPADQRDISSLTACVSDEIAAQIRDEINQTRARIITLAMSASKHERVYQITFQFFPVSQAPADVDN